jgi:hypothetical protein
LWGIGWLGQDPHGRVARLSATDAEHWVGGHLGRTLSADPGRWDRGVTFSYRWFANGKAIRGATGRKLSLAKAQRGRRITVRVTGHKPGYVAVTRTSKPTKRV